MQGQVAMVGLATAVQKQSQMMLPGQLAMPVEMETVHAEATEVQVWLRQSRHSSARATAVWLQQAER